MWYRGFEVACKSKITHVYIFNALKLIVWGIARCPLFGLVVNGEDDSLKNYSLMAENVKGHPNLPRIIVVVHCYLHSHMKMKA